MSSDLSEIHQPISDLFARVSTSQGWDQFSLSDEQVAFYHEHGYLAGVRIFSDSQVEALRAELAEIVVPDCEGSEYWYEFHSNESVDPNMVLFHALGAWRLRDGLHDSLWNPAFTRPASQLLGGDVRFWHDQLFCKPARHGGVVAWHQDYSYWTRTQPMGHLTCWIGLDDADVENGCLHYIPGSHRWDLLPITGLAGDVDAIREVLDDEQWNTFEHPVAVPLKAGEATFHHPLTIHGSFANKTNRPRRAVVLNTFLDGTRSDADEPLLDGVSVVPRGEKMDGQFFPRLPSGPSSAADNLH